MQILKNIISWGGIPVGFCISLMGIAVNAQVLSSWGWPAWVWYLIGLLVFTASGISIVVGYWRENKSLKAKYETGDAINIQLMEWRKDYRKLQSAEVTHIPGTLRAMWASVDLIMNEKKKRKTSHDKLLKLISELFDLDKNDPILNKSNYTTEDKIRKMTKRFAKKVGFHKSNAELEAKWRKRLAEKMDDYKIGLMLKESHEYMDLLNQLHVHSQPITRTIINNMVDGFVENLRALYSVKLFMAYGHVDKNIQIFPAEMRDVLQKYEEAVEKVMRTYFVKINEVLEDYSIGKELKDK